jgi:hypothetical protein
VTGGRGRKQTTQTKNKSNENNTHSKKTNNKATQKTKQQKTQTTQASNWKPKCFVVEGVSFFPVMLIYLLCTVKDI